MESPELIPLQGYKTPLALDKEPDENPIGQSWHPDDVRGFEGHFEPNTGPFFGHPHRMERSPSPLLSGTEEDSQSSHLEKTCPQEFIDFFDRFNSLDSEALVSEKGDTQERIIRDAVIDTSCGDSPMVNQENAPSSHDRESQHAYTCPSKSPPPSDDSLKTCLTHHPGAPRFPGGSEEEEEEASQYTERSLPADVADFFNRVEENSLRLSPS